MLKITKHHAPESESMSLLLEGRLAGPWVEELNSCWHQMTESQQSRTMIDLTGVTFVDAEGKALLTQMWEQGAKLHAVGCLTKCIVEEITKAGPAGSSCSSPKGQRGKG